MLPGMSRLVLLAPWVSLVIACGSKTAGDPQKTGEATGGSGEEKIVVPGTVGGPKTTEPAAPDDPTKLSEATKQRAQNPAFHLKPDEGTLTIAKAEAKPGVAVTAEVKLAPGSGYHVATDYPIKLWLESPSGVTLEKSFMTAGGRNKAQGDASTLTEQVLAFAVKATPDTAGEYQIQGVFTFGICEKDSCHPRTQPITIQVAAN